MNKEISLEEFAETVKQSKKERVTKRGAHREHKRLGTLDEELDKIDNGRDPYDK